MLIQSFKVPVGHTVPCVPGSWLGLGLYSQRGRGQGGWKMLFQGFTGLWWASDLGTVYNLKNVFHFSDNIENLLPDRFSPRLKCQIRLSNFQASWAILHYLSVGLKAGTLPGSTERSSPGFTAWHTPASYRFMTPAYKDCCNPQSPWGRFHSFLPCSWA